MSDPVIAIDGPAASGKSSAATLVAEKLGIAYINTGNMFRAVTLAAQRAGISRPDECTDEKLAPVLANLKLDYVRNDDGEFELQMDGAFPGAAIRAPEVAALVSPVATVGCVREYLKQIQRKMAGTQMIVMEGRDIGTVIFPQAKYKFFITASPEERARRRLAQSGENVSGATLAEVAAGIAERDRIDSSRAIAPLKPAEDAILIDNTHLQLEQVVDLIIRRVNREA